MIKGIIGYKVLNYKEVEPIFMQLRLHAIKSEGFISAENLVSNEDLSVVVMISTWETIENWNTWAESRITKDLLQQLQQAKAVVLGAYRLTAYKAMPTLEWS